jgi:pyruvate dehydrogenase kinase 2/3/4
MGRPRSRRQRGTVQPHCCLVREACAAASYASEICNENLYACPEIIIEPPSTESEADPLVVSYVPNHIWYTMVELLKNACLASLLAHSRPGQAWTQIKTGGVRVSFASSVEDGMGLADEELAFSYTYTGWKARPDQKWGLDLAGAGVGLPTVRQYARYFGGDLTYKRVQGEGNDQALSQMCLQLRHLPSAVEQL